MQTETLPIKTETLTEKLIWNPIEIAKTAGIRTLRRSAKIASEVVQKKSRRTGWIKSRISMVTNSNKVQQVTNVKRNKDLHNVAHLFECVE
jgi:hypothetical protein